MQIVDPDDSTVSDEVDKDDGYYNDHFFDNIDLHNPSTRPRRDDIAMGNAPLRGVTGIRALHYKVNEQLILPETRQGLIPQTFEDILNSDAIWLNFDNELV